MKDSRLVAFGGQVRKIRKKKGISQEALADLAGIDRSYMGHIERGDQNITLTKTFQIVEALEISIGDLFVDIGSMKSQTLKA